jgi:3',5'-cyclic AMP phosphodiesterase CpdA
MRAHRVLDFLDSMLTPVDALLVTGDLADHGTEAEYEEVRALLAGFSPPMLLCPGNHDARGAYRKVLLGEPASEEPINRVHDLLGVRVVMCDSVVPGRDAGRLSDDTLDWLAGVLTATPASIPVLVAMHHPPVLLHSPLIDEIRQYDGERLAALVEQHPQVVALLCGHAHTPAATTFAGRPLLVAPAVATTLRLPQETVIDLDAGMPPALAFHVLDDAARLTTHYRLVA